MPEQILLPEAEEDTPEVLEEPEVSVESDEPTEEPKEPKKPEETVESLAGELGWKPKDNFIGHGDDFVSAGEYIRRSKDIQDTMRNNLKSNKNKLSQVEKGLRDLKRHSETVMKSEIRDLKKRVEDTQTARDEAIEEGDKDAVYKADKEMSELREEAQSHIERVMQSQEEDKGDDHLDPQQVSSFKSWTQANPWYNSPGSNAGDKDMTSYADYLADSPEYAGLPYDRKIQAVTEVVKQKFPDKFNGNASRQPANSVESGRPTGMKKSYTSRDLSGEQRDIMNNFVKQGVMSEKDYIKDLVKIGELG